MLQNATQLNATSNVFLNHMLRRYSTITLYICTVSDDHEMWQFADIISNTQFAGTFGNSSDAVIGCVAVLCSTSTCMSEECQHAHHSRRSVTSDMWCHRKTLTYLHTYLLTVRVTCSDMDDTILIEQMAWQDYNWTRLVYCLYLPIRRHQQMLFGMTMETNRLHRSLCLEASMSDCSMRKPRFKTQQRHLCLSWRPLLYTALGMGCTPLLQCRGRLSLLPSAGWWNE